MVNIYEKRTLRTRTLRTPKMDKGVKAHCGRLVTSFRSLRPWVSLRSLVSLMSFFDVLKVLGVLKLTLLNADDRTRTSTLLLEVDFESTASTISPHRHVERRMLYQAPQFLQGTITSDGSCEKLYPRNRSQPLFYPSRISPGCKCRGRDDGCQSPFLPLDGRF